MAKLVAFAAVLVALLAVASAYRTTVTTVLDDESSSHHGGQQQQQGCSTQIQQQKEQIRHCAKYLQGQEESRYMRMVKSSSSWGEIEEPHLQECCRVLEKFDSQCRCEVVKEALRMQEEEQKQGQGQSQQQIMQKAKQLPKTCDLDEPQQCQIRVFYF